MIALILAGSLIFRAPLLAPGVPDSISSAERPMRVECARWRQSPTWLCCLRQWSPPEQWARYWPQARREAREAFGVWMRSNVAPGARDTFYLPPGPASYRVRACDQAGNCAEWSTWRSIP